MANIILKNVNKVYEGGVRAVKDFNLEIKDKEFIVFVGPSGCGKSTTLRMIAGLEEITSGDLFMDGQRANDIEPKDRNIAMVFQSYALYPHMTVFQNMAFGLKLRKVSKDTIKEKVNFAAKILGIEDLLNRKPKALSGGQRQRVALGRAIVREPNVFLLDEPLSNLDAKLRVQMRVEITKLQKKLSTTFIYVTHDQTEAMTMGDRIVVMKDGIVQQVDSPQALYEQPRNIFVATFLGSPQMNIFNARLLEKDNKLAILTKDNNLIYFPEIKAKQLISKSYLDQDILFGIRPENISISLKEGLKVRIDAIEHLGSETILYCKSGCSKENIIAKIPTNYDLKTDTEVYLVFDMKKAHAFDVNTQQSILGVPNVNKVKVTLVNSQIISIGTELINDADIIKHLLVSKVNELDYLNIDVSKVHLKAIPDSIKLNAKVCFVVDGGKEQTYYTKLDGLDDYFVFKDESNKFSEGDNVELFISKKDISFYTSNGLRISSKEEIIPNAANVDVKTKNGLTTINLGGKHLVYDDLGVEDGRYEFILHEFGPSAIYTKKFAKENSKEIIKTNNFIKVSAYDEDRIDENTNIVYLSAKGFNDYISVVLNDSFSVYKMPIFGLSITEKDFDLIKL